MTIVQSMALAMFVCTLVFGGLGVWTYRSRSRLPVFAPVSFCLGLGFAVLFVMLAIFGFAPIPLALFATAAGCSLFDMPPRRAQFCIFLVAIVMDVAYIAWFQAIDRQLATWKQRYPITSLTERLAYEKDLRVPIDHTWYRPRFVPDNVKREGMSTFESLMDQTAIDRQLDLQGHSFRSLYHLHHGIETQFSLAVGFGVMRTRDMPYRFWHVELPDHPLIYFPHEAPLPNLYGISEGTRGVDYRPWHDQNLLDFAHPRSLGYVEGSEKLDVIGFVPHGFSTRPVPPATSGDAYQPWRITTLSLVSLLKHRPGAVYVSDHLPSMQELTSVPTRELDAFEQRSLEKLRDGEELAVEGGSAEIRMLGAIRAAYQCQDCHQVKRGTLLGAFTYQLVRTNREQQEPSELAGQGSGQ